MPSRCRGAIAFDEAVCPSGLADKTGLFVGARQDLNTAFRLRLRGQQGIERAFRGRLREVRG